MHKSIAVFVLAALAAVAPPTVLAEPVTMAWSHVGNPGNAPDNLNGSLYGAVSYSYNIGTYDVTIGQYTAFLNSVAAADPYGLYSPTMGTLSTVAGIARSGSSGSYTYSLIGNSANLPVAVVSWTDAACFANWMQNGQPVGPEGPSTTETGAYTINRALTGTGLNAITRNAGATVFIPSEDEWFKAAYYNPATSSYYKYPFSSNIQPTSALPGNTPNTGNFIDAHGNYALTGSNVLNGNSMYLSPVGAYTASASPYGAYDMGGLLFQWTEGIRSDVGAGVVLGGAWDDPVDPLLAGNRAGVERDGGNYAIGFRLASVPEPGASVLALLALATLGALRKRLR